MYVDHYIYILWWCSSIYVHESSVLHRRQEQQQAVQTRQWTCDEVDSQMELYLYKTVNATYSGPWSRALPTVLWHEKIGYRTQEDAYSRLADARVRRAFACALLDGASLTELAEIANVNPHLLQAALKMEIATSVGQYFIQRIYVEEMEHLASLYFRLSEWNKKTGFPNYPLNTTKEELMEFFKSLQEDYDFRLLLMVSYNLNGVPLLNSPEKIAETLMAGPGDDFWYSDIDDTIKRLELGNNGEQSAVEVLAETAEAAKEWGLYDMAFEDLGSPVVPEHCVYMDNVMQTLVDSAFEDDSHIRQWKIANYTLLVPEERIELACAMAGAHSLLEFASVIGQGTESDVKHMRRYFSRFNLEERVAVDQLITDTLTWIHRTNFPNEFPVPFEETKKLFQAITENTEGLAIYKSLEWNDAMEKLIEAIERSPSSIALKISRAYDIYQFSFHQEGLLFRFASAEETLRSYMFQNRVVLELLIAFQKQGIDVFSDPFA